MFRLQFLAIVGMLMLIACSNGAEVQTPPDPTPDIPVLRDGEVLGLVQKSISDRPECDWAFLNVQHMTPVYVGDGVWVVRLQNYGWEVFDQSKIVRAFGRTC